MAVKTKARTKTRGRTAFQSCMRKSLKGKHFGSASAARSALGKAARACGMGSKKRSKKR